MKRLIVKTNVFIRASHLNSIAWCELLEGSNIESLETDHQESLHLYGVSDHSTSVYTEIPVNAKSNPIITTQLGYIASLQQKLSYVINQLYKHTTKETPDHIYQQIVELEDITRSINDAAYAIHIENEKAPTTTCFPISADLPTSVVNKHAPETTPTALTEEQRKLLYSIVYNQHYICHHLLDPDDISELAKEETTYLKLLLELAK